MSNNDPLMIVLVFGCSLYLFRYWLIDYRNKDTKKATMPGATSCSFLCISAAILGALVLLFLETWGEYELGISSEQNNVTVIALLSFISAAFIEELIFRGYLVIENKGRKLLIAGIIVISILFAILHPYLWKWDGGLNLKTELKPLFSTVFVFINSIWFYIVRFMPMNKNKSLIPCILAHLSSNLGVFFVKLAQGHVSGWL